MQKPKMILFDYGQTLVDEGEFQGVRGAEAVLQYAVKNPCRRTAEEVQRAADQLNRSLGRFGPASGHMHHVEIPNHMFNAYLYGSQGIELSLLPEQIDEVFWNAAAGETHGGDRRLSHVVKGAGHPERSNYQYILCTVCGKKAHPGAASRAFL